MSERHESRHNVDEGRFRRPILVCTGLSLLGEQFLLLVFGVWLFPEGSLLSKAIWTIVLCGTGMGIVAGVAVGALVFTDTGQRLFDRLGV